MRLQPSMTLGEIYGPDRVFAPRAHPQACDWLSDDPVLLDSLSGNQLTICGAMPVVCSAGFGMPAALELLDEAGLQPAPDRCEYRRGEGIAVALETARIRCAKLVLQHVYPEGAAGSDMQWIDPKLLRYLNDKANLGELAPAEHLPDRRVVCRDCFFNGLPPALPIVLKAVSQQSTGGGAAIMICRTAQDISTAAEFFARCEKIVVESFLSISRNLCLHLAILADGQLRYLGYADQDVTEQGRYRGNWMQLGSALPNEIVEIATEVARRGAVMGYRGIVGIDMAVLEDGQIVVVDLNFRVNGSTAAVLLASAMLEARGPKLVHLRSFKGRRSDFEAMLPIVRHATTDGYLIPLSIFDPVHAGHAAQPPRLKGMILADSQEEALRIESDLSVHGLA